MFKISFFVFRVGSRVRFCSDKPKPPRSDDDDFGGHLERGTLYQLWESPDLLYKEHGV